MPNAETNLLNACMPSEPLPRSLCTRCGDVQMPRVDLPTSTSRIACQFGRGFTSQIAPARAIPETDTVPRAILTLEFGPGTVAALDRLAQAHEQLAAAIERLVLGQRDGALGLGDVAPSASGSELGRIAGTLDEIRGEQRRIANHFDPPPPDIIGTEYVAGKLGCTQTWIGELVHNGKIPTSAIVPGTGNGKPWKFYRSKIERWLRDR